MHISDARFEARDDRTDAEHAGGCTSNETSQIHQRNMEDGTRDPPATSLECVSIRLVPASGGSGVMVGVCLVMGDLSVPK